jgi:hypothetical protein
MDISISSPDLRRDTIDLGRAAVMARSWDITNAQLNNKIEELLHE